MHIQGVARKVFTSFVSSACDVREIKEYLPDDCELVSKIETINGIKNIEEIIASQIKFFNR